MAIYIIQSISATHHNCANCRELGTTHFILDEDTKGIAYYCSKCIVKESQEYAEQPFTMSIKVYPKGLIRAADSIPTVVEKIQDPL